ncbi:tripartite tricarboxylate transporter TctB family protein [Ferrovibrio sp.]|uniref:tripartite tricarboxylate transporter TctB family protein n=1 Tax=Ferrovibrio sp. TaxID=1917215 RepID=UPI0035ADB67D
MQGLIRNPKDFWSGVMFTAVGLAFAWISQDYQFGSARRMGAGFFPMVLALILAALGAFITLRALFTEGEGIRGLALKGLLLVPIGCLIFAATVRGGGILLSVGLLVLVSAAASVHFKLRTAAIMMVVLAAFCALVFTIALGLPIPMVGPWFGN